MVARALLAALFLLAAACGEYVGSRTLEFQGAEQGFARVEVHAHNGSVTLTGEEDREAVSGAVSVRAVSVTSQHEVDSSLGDARITERLDGDTLVLELVLPGALEWEVALDVRVPAGIPVSALTQDGAVELVRVSVERIESSNGGVSLTGTAGDAVVRTSNGDLRVDGHAGSLELETTNGRVTVKGLHGDLDARTTHAPCAAEVTLDDDPRIQLSTSEGDLGLLLRGEFRGEMLAHTLAGQIEVDGLNLERTDEEAGELRGLTPRTGDGRIDLFTNRGDILIEARDR